VFSGFGRQRYNEGIGRSAHAAARARIERLHGFL
jgi:hypothetical protein